MSKANGIIENKDSYLQHVSLKNYKSIKDAEIDFKPGLNIIIGKNASGKTNFVNALDKILDNSYNEILGSEFKIDLCFRNNNVVIRKQKSNQPLQDFIKNNHHSLIKFDIDIEVNGDAINDKKNDTKYYPPIYALSERGYNLDKKLVKYGIAYGDTSQFINIPFSFVIGDNGKISEYLVFYVMGGENHTKLINSFFERLYKFLIEVDNDIFISDIVLKDRIISFANEFFEDINYLISKYSPIRLIRLNNNFNVITENENRKKTITNFYLEFLIDQSWLPFNLLSDGTKRLFYIISEILASYNSVNLLYNNDLKVILLEEPELGIHPHQLHQLMQFIKEQAREKQIILTTHSPQVLDLLGPDELDRIIICSYDAKKGTQLNHLTEKEIEKARKYMKEEAFLSDYWRFSDLEPAS